MHYFDPLKSWEKSRLCPEVTWQIINNVFFFKKKKTFVKNPYIASWGNTNIWKARARFVKLSLKSSKFLKLKILSSISHKT